LFPYLLLAHFLADYPLQTDWIVRNKQRFKVLTLHIAIHWVTMFVIVGAARVQLWPYLTALAGMHFVIDIWKNWMNRRWPRWVVWPYVVDQIFHFITIGFTAEWIRRALPQVAQPFSPELAIYATGFLVVTYVWFVSERILAHSTPEYREEVICHLWLRMAARAGLLAVFLLTWRASLNGPAAALVLPLPYSNGKYRWRALFTDIGVAFAVMILMEVGLGVLG
jgi:hypothetical protein